MSGVPTRSPWAMNIFQIRDLARLGLHPYTCLSDLSPLGHTTLLYLGALSCWHQESERVLSPRPDFREQHRGPCTRKYRNSRGGGGGRIPSFTLFSRTIREQQQKEDAGAICLPGESTRCCMEWVLCTSEQMLPT